MFGERISAGARAMLDAVALRPDDPGFVLSRALMIEGDLSEGALRATLDMLVERHEALRAQAVWDGPVLTLRLGQPAPIPLFLVEAGGADEKTVAEELARIVAVPLDIWMAPLARVHLLRLDGRRSLLVLAAHHLICDLTSASLLVRELLEQLGHRSIDHPSSTPIESVRRVSSHDGARDFCPAPGGLHSRPADSISGAFDADLAKGVAAFCRSKGLRPFVLFLAAWTWVGAREGDLTKIEVGVFSSGRTRADARQIGPFSLMVDVPVELRPNLPAIEHVQAVAAAVGGRGLGAFAPHSTAAARTFRAVRTFGYQKARSRADGFSAAFALGERSQAVRIGDLTIESWHTPVSRIDGELRLCFAPSDDGWLWRIDYDRNLRDATAVNVLARHMTAFLCHLIAKPESALRAVSLLDADERRAVEVVATSAPIASLSLNATIDAIACCDPSRTAIVCDHAVWSYADVRLASEAVARKLTERGLGPGSLVAVAAEASPDSVAALLGVLRAGAAFVPLPIEGPLERVTMIVDDTSPRAILVSRRASNDGFLLDGAETLEDWTQGARIGEGFPVPADLRPGDLAYVLYTSGSSGRPKGVEVSRANLDGFLSAAMQALPVRADDRFLLLQPFTFDIALLEAFLPLMLGAILVTASQEDRRSPGRLMERLDRFRVTVMQATPTLWGQLLAGGWRDAAGMLCLCGGEAMSADLATGMLARHARLWNLYGPTEATIWCSAGPVVDPARIDIGSSLPGFTQYVLDEDLSPTPLGCVGELWIGGLGVASGYRNDAARTCASFVPDPWIFGGRLYRTGDRVRRTPDARLVYVGRADRQLKISGQRVEPGEIEAVLRDVAGVADAVVVDLRTAAGGVVLVAFIVLPSGEDLDEADLNAALRRRLPGHMVPSRMVALSALPTLSSGKRDVAALRELAAATERRPKVAAAPGTDSILGAVLEVWSDILGVPLNDAEADFFAVGGQSLQLMRSANRLSELFGVRLGIDELWASPRASHVARRLRERIAIEKAPRTAPPVAPDRYLATQTQRRIWAAHQLDPTGALYAIPMLLELDGRLSSEDLQRALQDLAHQHDVLNSRFGLDNGALWVTTAPPCFPMQVRSAALGVDVDQVAIWIAEHLDAPFDLTAGPLARALWLERSDAPGLLLVTIHHVIVDGASLPVLLRDFVRHLRRSRVGEVVAIEPSRIFAAHARYEPADTRPDDAALDYWRQRLSDNFQALVDATEPYDESEASVGRVEFSVSTSFAVRRIARSAGVSVFSVLVALVQGALHEVTGQRELLFAVDVSRRHDASLDEAVGLFVDQMLLPTTVREHDELPARAGAVHRALMEGMGHFVPFGSLAAALGSARRLDAIKLAELPLAMESARVDDGLVLRPLPVHLTPSRHDATIFLLTGGKQVTIIIDCNEKCYAPGLGTEIARHIRRLAEALGE